MRRSVVFLVDELPDALRRAAEYLGAGRIQLERLTVTPGQPSRLTAVFPADTIDATVEGFARAVRGVRKPIPALPRAALPKQPEAPAPFQWQADGAGDFPVV
jgi:hypothetical protein